MANHYLYYNDHSSRAYYCHIEHKPKIPTPAPKYEEYEVGGRNGKLLADLGYYDNIKVSYKIYYHGKEPTAAVARSVKHWLAGAPGAHRLADSYDPGFFYNATATVGDITNVLNKYGRFTVEFDCDPRHFSVDGQRSEFLTNGQKLRNPFPQTALPELVISGNGETGTLSINGETLDVGTYSDTQIVVDGENQNAYTLSGLSANNRIYGMLPSLPEGENVISWSGGITAVLLTPRWWTL